MSGNDKSKIERKKKIVAGIAIFLAILMVLGTLVPIFFVLGL